MLVQFHDDISGDPIILNTAHIVSIRLNEAKDTVHIYTVDGAVHAVDEAFSDISATLRVGRIVTR